MRKNLKWIADHAELYPNETVVVSGTLLKNFIPPKRQKLQRLSNVILAGYLSDGEVKALMQTCKTFVLPSYFEGFGIPPLEALACGALLSNVASLFEKYSSARSAKQLFELLQTIKNEWIDLMKSLNKTHRILRTACQKRLLALVSCVAPHILISNTIIFSAMKGNQWRTVSTQLSF